MLEKTYGNSVLLKSKAYEWYKPFKDSREVFVDMPLSDKND